MSHDLTALREHVRALEERVAALEQPPPRIAPQPPPSPVAEDDGFWALTGLRSRLADHPSTAEGEVMIVGATILPDGAPVSWQESQGTGGLIETNWADHSATFAALGHPVRLELLRHILSGTHATADLAAMDSLGTTGQLHHHLRQLVTAGWVRQSGRGSYEVPAARVVPLLASVIGAQR